MANLYDKAQYIFVAGANKSGSIYGLSPIAGTTNVTLVTGSTTRLASASRTNNNGIIELVAPHILRVDYSGTSSCPSYKFEPDRINYLYTTDHLMTGSLAPAGQDWFTNNVSWSLVADPTSPVGTGYTGFIQESSSAGSTGYYHRQTTTGQISSVATSSRYVASVYVKRSGSGADVRNVMLTHAGIGNADRDINVYFILEGTGSIVSTSNTPKLYTSGAYIEQLPNNWYRCSVYGTATPASAGLRIYIISGSNTGSLGYTPNGRSGLYVCGAQLESGSALGTRDPNTYTSFYNWGTPVTSYMSSSMSTNGVRNAADQTILLPSSSNSSAWTVFVTYKQSDPSSQGDSAIFSVSSGSSYAGFYAGGWPVWSAPGAPAGSPSGSQVFTNIEHKLALRLSSGNQLTWFRDGAQLFTITWPSSGRWGNLHIGSLLTSTEPFVGRGSFYVRTVAMFNQELSNNECISLTLTGSGTI